MEWYLRQVDGREGRARVVARAAKRAREAARQAREGRGAQVEGGARLHDGPRSLARPVRRRHVARQVRAQLELLRTLTTVTTLTTALRFPKLSITALTI